MKEKDLTTLFSHWVSAHRGELDPFVFEAKIVHLDREKSLGLGKFQDHQLPTLRMAAGLGVYWKVPDLGSQNPFDGFFFRGEAYVVIFWFIPRKLKLCTMIRIQDWDKFFDGVDKKSIRMEEAKGIASQIVDL